jgi:signal transduction histidine kinase
MQEASPLPATARFRYGATTRVFVIVASVAAISLAHFLTSTEYIHLHQIYQRSYYIPIVLASYWFEVLGGLATALGLTAVYLVHIVQHWEHDPVYSFEQYAEIAMYIAVALLAGYLFRVQRKARERLEIAGAELKSAYQKLNETVDQLRHSDRLASLGRLSAGIAHEIRNPLGSIQGAVEILSAGVAPADAKWEFADIAKKEIRRLNAFVGEILQFSRPAKPKRLPSDPREIVEAARRLCSDLARRQGVEIAEEIPPSLPQLMVDPEQIKQVLLNVLLNAIQAQPAGGRVLIKAFSESPHVVITVRDCGPGIEPENLERIFEPFFTTKHEGTGLGLSISYQLVRNNAGQIRVTSTPGEGACFSITLPSTS